MVNEVWPNAPLENEGSSDSEESSESEESPDGMFFIYYFY